MTTRGAGPTLGLAIIAKNEEEALPRLLASVEGVFDQVVLVDTGSEDGTEEVFRAWADRQPTPFSWKCEQFEWVDDFSKAREFSYSLLETDWTCWADADDFLRNAGHLRTLAEQCPPDAAGFIFPYEYAHDAKGNVICRLERERLVRRGIGERWDLPVHEVLHVPGSLARTESVVWVHGQNPDSRDPERNYKILKADEQKALDAGEPVSPRTLVYLGTELLALDRPSEAIPYLTQYLTVGEWDEEICQAAHKSALANRILFDRSEAKGRDIFLNSSKRAALRAIEARPDWPEGYLDMAEVAMREDKYAEVLRWVEQAKLRPAPVTLLITNPLEYQIVPLLLESAARAKLGEVEVAFDLTMQALDLAPTEPLANQARGLQQEVKVRDTIKHVLIMYELLVRHDENLKALELLKNVPYYIYDHPQIAQARTNARECVLHAVDSDLYSSFYRENPNEAPFELQGVPIEDAHKRFNRVDFLRRGLAEQRQQTGRQQLRVLDLSGNDGWMIANLASANYSCDMLEMNPEPVGRARDRARKYAGVKRVECGNLYEAPEIFEPGSYDAVVCFETIEHVPDPGSLLDVMAKMVKPGGRCYVSTPEGAFERGQDPVMASWHTVEMKGHLRAIRPVEMAEWLAERGVVEGFELEQKLIQCAFTPRDTKGRVVFYAGPADAEPEKIRTEGLGGSETALCKLAEQFARRGYDVRVFAGSADPGLRGDHVTTGEDKMTGQVLYQPHHAWDPGLEADLFIASRAPGAFDRTIKAKRSVLWLHDADYLDNITPERIDRVDEVVVLSEFQRELFASRYPFMADKLWVSSNAIEPKFFADPKPLTERKPWVVYSSSPDRGLDVLLECWPEIRKRVPEAELHCGYVPYYQEAAAFFPHLKPFHAKLTKQLDQEGVVNFGSLPQQSLAKLYGTARVWGYPSWTGWLGEQFPEISCITAMECQAAGCVPVCADYGALAETVTAGAKIPSASRDETWRKAFIDEVVHFLTDDKEWQEHSLRGRTTWLSHSWDTVADTWEERFGLGCGCESCECEAVAA